ncbi:N-acetylmuramidase domain-containing protein [Oceanicella actignis]|uniref:Putative peptidoglycan binding domain-containing protein n=1 Tax=Oceanicella actignis TaxID=1189325 RepID=A0A1M7TS64_9RHOB|nr:N-acetylmuramidase domain-containing protein [Oceanicella actignis]SET77048.1 Putative peptidoglycan binding domain-containing protein [Oceanicella actignis]SHN73572.1 Putative peptidoglycan binding domain-containing protein [Oceanicella actignis]
MNAFKGSALPIRTDAPYRALADELGCEVAAIKAVAEVESRGAAFLPDGRPTILFERHVFRRLTGGAFDAAAPDLSAPAPGGYGPGGAAQYARLERATALDREAALRATSWGRFQIMGFNAELVGFAGVEPFVAAMCESEAAQLAAFGAYVRAAGLAGALARRDWTAFARGYNGPDWRRNAYDRKLAAAYARHAGDGRGEGPSDRAAGAFRVRGVRELQAALDYLGADPGPADGLMGPRTAAAIRRFERQCRLPPTGAPGPALMAAVQAVYFALGGPERPEAALRGAA